MSRRRALVPAAALLAAAGCTALPAPSSLSDGEVMLELTQTIQGLRDENTYLQAQVDSLREAVARQDTLITRLAATNGLVLPPR